jgi:hypothetical protein
VCVCVCVCVCVSHFKVVKELIYFNGTLYNVTTLDMQPNTP